MPGTGRWKLGLGAVLAGRRGLLRAMLLVVLLGGLGVPAQAQTDVVDLLLRERRQTRTAELLAGLEKRLTPRPHQEMYTLNLYWLWMQRNLARKQAIADSLARAEAAPAATEATEEAPPPVALPIAWQKADADDQGPFIKDYREVFWRAISAPHPADTMATPKLRALLNGLFGAPTRNAAAMEQEAYAGSEYVQFEYWLVANDSIPLLVLDLDGPFGRGLLVAGDEEFREHFTALKHDLFERMLASEPVPYADYYHSLDRDRWFRTGFNGEEYFVRDTRRPRWASSRSRDEKWHIFR